MIQSSNINVMFYLKILDDYTLHLVTILEKN